jgi:toxin FitB
MGKAAPQSGCREVARRPVGTMDAYIAATAEQHDLTLVTRNVSDFEILRIGLLNLWRND